MSLGQDSNYTSERSIIALRGKRPRKPKSRGTRSCAGDSCAGPAVPAPGARDRDAPRSTAGPGRNEAAVCATLRALSEGHGGGGGSPPWTLREGLGLQRRPTGRGPPSPAARAAMEGAPTPHPICTRRREPCTDRALDTR